MKRTKTQPPTIGELTREQHAERMENEADRHIVQNIIKEANTPCPSPELTLDDFAEMKRILDEADISESWHMQFASTPKNSHDIYETSGTNNSLMVYTSSVNSTNVEDSTMSNKTALQEVRTEIDTLREALSNDVQKVGNILLSAEMASYINCPSETGQFLSEEWVKSNEKQGRFLKDIVEGSRPEGLNIRLTNLSSSSHTTLTNDVADAIAAFEDRIVDTYQMPMMKLMRKRSALDKIVDAERDLARADNTNRDLFYF